MMALYSPMEHEKLIITKHIVVTSPIFCFMKYLCFRIACYRIIFSDKSRTRTLKLNNHDNIGLTKSNIYCLVDCFCKKIPS